MMSNRESREHQHHYQESASASASQQEQYEDEDEQEGKFTNCSLQIIKLPSKKLKFHLF